MSTTKKIVLVWVIVGIVIAGTIIISTLTFNPYPNDTVVFNVLPQKTTVTPDYAYEDLDTADYKILGADPTPIGVPQDITFQGYMLFTPKDENGALLSNQRAVFAQFNNFDNQNRKVFSVMSETSNLLIDNYVSEMNRGLNLEEDAWSEISGTRVKIYRFSNDSTNNTLFALMILNGHFWRIEANQLKDTEFVNIIRTTILAYK